MGEGCPNRGCAYGGVSDEAEAVMPLGPGTFRHAAVLRLIGE